MKTFDSLYIGSKFLHRGNVHIKLKTHQFNACDTTTGEAIHLDSGQMVQPVSSASEIHADWLMNL